MSISIKLAYTAALPLMRVQEIKSQLQDIDVNLTLFDKNKQKTNHFDSYAASNCLIIEARTYAQIQEGEAQQYWLAIVETVRLIRPLIKASQESYGLQISLDYNTVFNFQLDHAFDEKTFELALQQLHDFMEVQQPIVGFGNPFFVYFLKDAQQWKKVEVLDLMEEEAFEPRASKKNWKSKKKKKK